MKMLTMGQENSFKLSNWKRSPKEIVIYISTNFNGFEFFCGMLFSCTNWNLKSGTAKVYHKFYDIYVSAGQKCRSQALS